MQSNTMMEISKYLVGWTIRVCMLRMKYISFNWNQCCLLRWLTYFSVSSKFKACVINDHLITKYLISYIK